MIKRNISSLIFSVLFVLNFAVAHGQNDPQEKGVNIPLRNQNQADKASPKDDNLGNFNADNMSDTQVQDMMRRMSESGYSESQLEQVAKARGMDAVQIQKLRERAQKLKTQPRMNVTARENKEDSLYNAKREPTNSANLNSNQRIFGAQFFNSGFSSFEPNLNMPTPASYIIGPGDQLLIDLTGDNEVSYKQTVSSEGFISIEYIGRVAVGGLTVEQAKGKIKTQMENTYSSLRNGRTQLSLNLGNIRSIKVVISGEVMKPGTYTLPSFASVFNALYNSGGPNDKGSFRNIQIIRNNRIIATVDLYDFLLNGIQTGNMRLQDQDVIHIPVYQIHVDVVGEVKRSMIYEITTKESLLDIFKYAGGFSDLAYKARVKIIQNTVDAQKIVIVPLSEFANYTPKNGDRIYVEAIFDKFENKVQINGAVVRPGIFEFRPGLKLSELIQQSNGLTPDVFMNNGYIVRINSDNTSSIVSFDLEQVMKGGNSDIELQRNDVVQISSIFDLRDEYTVSIGGEVRKPGSFSFSDNLTVENLIQMAGGFKNGANPANIEISRRIKSADLTQKAAEVAQVFSIAVDSSLRMGNQNFLLQPFDIVSIRPTEGFVPLKQIEIIGEVIRPGVYTIKYKNERISDVIKRAGGLTAFAYTEGASLKRTGTTSNNELEKAEKMTRELNLVRLSEEVSDKEKALSSDLTNASSDLVGIELEKILNTPQSRNDLILEGGDIIRIPSQLQTVKISGEVLRPISVLYVPGRSLKYYINSAGGFTPTALKRGSFVSYSNGSVKGTNRTLFLKNYPEIKPGSEILVPKKAEREKMSAQSLVSLGTGIASLAALIFAIVKP